MRPPISTSVLLLAGIFACSSNASNASGSGSTSSSSTASGSSATATSSSGAGGGSGIPGTIAGSAQGQNVTVVATSYAVGASDDPAHTVVVYVFTKATQCTDTSAPGWDTKLGGVDA